MGYKLSRRVPRAEPWLPPGCPPGNKRGVGAFKRWRARDPELMALSQRLGRLAGQWVSLNFPDDRALIPACRGCHDGET